MSLNKYIKWDEIWSNEVDLTVIDYLTSKGRDVILQFNQDNSVRMIIDECEFDEDDIEFTFQFSETGGQNESDPQGWSRDYWITVDEDFILIDAQYEQG